MLKEAIGFLTFTPKFGTNVDLEVETPAPHPYFFPLLIKTLIYQDAHWNLTIKCLLPTSRMLNDLKVVFTYCVIRRQGFLLIVLIDFN